MLNTNYKITYTSKNKPLKSKLNCRNNSEISFGKITPEHLFIKIEGFEKNKDWANKVIEIIKENSDKLKQKIIPFNKLLENIKNGYKEAMSHISPNPMFGTVRSYEAYVDFLSHGNGRYSSYTTRANDYLKKFGDNILVINNIKLNRNSPKITEISIIQHDSMYSIKNDPIIKTCQPHNFDYIFKAIEEIYKNIMKERKKFNSKKKLKRLNEQIAKIHWIFAHTMPYGKGSAGIADALTKTIYESLNIQVAPWKKGVSPDLEAFVTPLDKFIENYTELFEIPPHFMNKAKKFPLKSIFEKVKNLFHQSKSA